MNTIHRLASIITLVAVFATYSIPVSAFEFDPNNIISDTDLVNYSSMDLGAIQSFLESQTGILAWLITADVDGNLKRASEIIYEAAQKYRVNPKVLLVKLQKEQSLIANPNPTQRDLDWAMGYGVCDTCRTSDESISKLRGFGVQVDSAAWQLRAYVDNSNRYGFLPGQTRTVSGIAVTPYNQATASLYNYTPHIQGNLNFWRLWNRWFGIYFPDGTLVRQEGEPGVWLIESGMRRPFWTKTALMTRFPNPTIITISRNDLERHAIGMPIKFPNYSLVANPAGDIYLLVGNDKKKIASPEVFRSLGYNPEEVIHATDDELAWYRDGRSITLESLYPAGDLLQDSKTGGVYYVEDGIKYPIWAKEVLVIRFGANRTITRVAQEHLDKFPTGQGVRLPDGTLIQEKGAREIYVISNGKKRLIANQQTFDQLSYKKEAINIVSAKILEIHPDDAPLDLLIPSQTTIATIR